MQGNEQYQLIELIAGILVMALLGYYLFKFYTKNSQFSELLNEYKQFNVF